MPEGFSLALIATLVLAVIFDYINGFHDTANAIATSVSTRALKPEYAIVLSASYMAFKIGRASCRARV